METLDPAKFETLELIVPKFVHNAYINGRNVCSKVGDN